MNQNVKYLILAAGGFVIIVSASIAAKSIYTHTKIGIDYKAAIIASGIGIGTIYLMQKNFK
jgi:hypothetical protein